MSNTSIPDDIRRYVIHRVPSVPYLEAILLLRENRQQVWQSDQVARRLYLGEAEAAKLLARLQEDGIVTEQAGQPGRYHYAPATGELDELLARLASVYAHNLIAISTLIHSKTTGNAQVLADAFVWRKEK
jgi:hypothetical protein